MATIERSIEIGAPVSAVYHQWMRCEDFARFMDGIELVRWLDEGRLHWRARIAGRIEEWDAEIIEQIPDKRIAWTSTAGAANAGVVTFHQLAPDRTRVMVQLDCCPRTWSERAGVLFGVLRRRVRRDLVRFKALAEWRRRNVASGRTRDALADRPVHCRPISPQRAKPQLHLVHRPRSRPTAVRRSD